MIYHPLVYMGAKLLCYEDDYSMIGGDSSCQRTKKALDFTFFYFFPSLILILITRHLEATCLYFLFPSQVPTQVKSWNQTQFAQATSQPYARNAIQHLASHSGLMLFGIWDWTWLDWTAQNTSLLPTEHLTIEVIPILGLPKIQKR